MDSTCVSRIQPAGLLKCFYHLDRFLTTGNGSYMVIRHTTTPATLLPKFPYCFISLKSSKMYHDPWTLKSSPFSKIGWKTPLPAWRCHSSGLHHLAAPPGIWNFLMVGRWPFRCLGLPSSWDKLRIWKHQPEHDSWLTSGFRKNADHNYVLKLKAPYKDASRTWMTKQGETIMPGDAGFLTLGVSLMSFTPLHTPTNCFDFHSISYTYPYTDLSCFGLAFCKKKVRRILPEACLNMKVDVRVHQKHKIHIT